MVFDPRIADHMTQQEYYKYKSKDRWGQISACGIASDSPASSACLFDCYTLSVLPQQWRLPVSAMANGRMTRAGHLKTHVTSIELSFSLCRKQPIRAARGYVPK